MALRIGGAKKAPPVMKEEEAVPEQPVEEALPEPEPEAEEPEMDLPTEGDDSHLLDQQTAGYKDPEEGPFMCSNCKYFSQEKENTCKFVSGYIDEMGLCNIFSPARQKSKQEEAPEEEVPMEEEAPPAEPPIEEPTPEAQY